MRTIAIVNQKGGCGKTTTSINLASTLAAQGDRVLIVDMDPQGHCAAGLGVPEERLDFCMARALLSEPAGGSDPRAWLWNAAKGIHLAPSSVALAGLESARGGLATRPDRDRRLAQMLDRLAEHFEWCVVDCPPTIGYLTFNALRAADEALVPVETGYFAFKAAERQLASIQSLVAQMERPLAVRIVPTLHRANSQLSHDIVQAIARRHGADSVAPAIRDHEVLREAASFGQSVVEFAPGTPAAADFEALAAWLRGRPVVPRPADRSVTAPVAPLALETGPVTIEVDGEAIPAVYGGQSNTGHGRAAELAQRLRLGPAAHAAGETG
jgi:chromosome partitioning protein